MEEDVVVDEEFIILLEVFGGRGARGERTTEWFPLVRHTRNTLSFFWGETDNLFVSQKELQKHGKQMVSMDNRTNRRRVNDLLEPQAWKCFLYCILLLMGRNGKNRWGIRKTNTIKITRFSPSVAKKGVRVVCMVCLCCRCGFFLFPFWVAYGCLLFLAG